MSQENNEKKETWKWIFRIMIVAGILVLVAVVIIGVNDIKSEIGTNVETKRVLQFSMPDNMTINLILNSTDSNRYDQGDLGITYKGERLALKDLNLLSDRLIEFDKTTGEVLGVVGDE